jgi:nucleoside phosphorylase
VAATTLELSAFGGAETLVCGVGPVEAAATTARRLARNPATAVLHLGIAGARDLEPGTLVLGAEAIYCDLAGQRTSVELVDRVAPDARMLEIAAEVLPEARVLTIGTAARVGGAAVHAEVEAMEGFAVLRAAAEAGVPALELRAVSNRFSDRREEWRIAEALEALARAVPRVLEALDA